MAWVLLGSFCQIYNENQEQKSELKDTKFLQFGLIGSTCKVGTEKNTFTGKNTGIKKNPCTLHRTIGKIPWGNQCRLEGEKKINSFENLCFENTEGGCLGKYFP